MHELIQHIFITKKQRLEDGLQAFGLAYSIRTEQNAYSFSSIESQFDIAYTTQCLDIPFVKHDGLHEFVPDVAYRISSADQSAANIIATNLSNSGATSCGPGLASGWPWKLKAGASLRAMP